MKNTTPTEKLHMFLSYSNLSYSVYAASESEAWKILKEKYPASVGWVYLGAQ